MTIETERLRMAERIQEFLDGSTGLGFKPANREETYGSVRRTLVRLYHGALGRADKGVVREFLAKTAGLSRAQTTRLIARHRETGRIEDRRGANCGGPFARV